MTRRRAEQAKGPWISLDSWVRPSAYFILWSGLPQAHSHQFGQIEGIRGNTHLLVLCLINPCDKRKGDDDLLFPQNYLSTNCRLMLLSGTKTVRVIGLIGAAPGSGRTSKWTKIWKGREKAVTTKRATVGTSLLMGIISGRMIKVGMAPGAGSGLLG